MQIFSQSAIYDFSLNFRKFWFRKYFIGYGSELDCQWHLAQVPAPTVCRECLDLF